MQIKIFTPPKFKKQDLNIKKLNNLTGKNWQYSSSGRASIYQILKNSGIKKVLIPAYICDTVLIPLKKLQIEPIFYDLDLEDLNPSLESIKELSKKYNVKAVLVASLYGNPANLIEIEEYCKENGIFMIDDAAQSFGAKLDDRFVGTFGNGGFFSFSPGKPTAGHMGSFFWIEKEIKSIKTKHCWVHYLKWIDFYINRYKIYENRYKIFGKIIKYFNIFLGRIVNIFEDDICEFEKGILGGILWSNLENKFDFRQKYHNRFLSSFEKNNLFRIIHSIRGIPNNHKIVLCFYEKSKAISFMEFMRANNIFTLNGYKVLSKLENVSKIDGKVVELPIEDNEKKMNYMFKKVKEYENNHRI